MSTIAIACDCDFAITILRLIARHFTLVDAQGNISIMKIYAYISNTLLLYVVPLLKIIKINSQREHVIWYIKYKAYYACT